MVEKKGRINERVREKQRQIRRKHVEEDRNKKRKQ